MELKIVCLFFASIILLRDASGTIFVVKSAYCHPMSPFLAPVPCRFACYFFSLNTCCIFLRETVPFGVFIGSWKWAKQPTQRETGKCISHLPPFSFIPPWACPPSSSLVPCVKVSGAILASLDLCGSEWETVPRPRLLSALHWLSFLGWRDFCCAEFYGWYALGHLS